MFELCRANDAEGLIVFRLVVDLHARQLASVQEKDKQIAQRNQIVTPTCAQKTELVETGKHHVSTEDVLKLLLIVNDLPRTVLLVNDGVNKLGHKAKVNEVERHLSEDISLQIFLGEVFSEIHQNVVQL